MTVTCAKPRSHRASGPPLPIAARRLPWREAVGASPSVALCRGLGAAADGSAPGAANKADDAAIGRLRQRRQRRGKRYSREVEVVNASRLSNLSQ